MPGAAGTVFDLEFAIPAVVAVGKGIGDFGMGDAGKRAEFCKAVVIPGDLLLIVVALIGQGYLEGEDLLGGIGVGDV